MPKFEEERSQVARLRQMRQNFSPPQQQQSCESRDDIASSHVQAAESTATLQPISASYDDIMSLIGPTNYPTMVELFRGGSGLPDRLHPEVTVSFELFEAIQRRLVATRDELEAMRKDHAQKTQQCLAAQTELSRTNDRIATLTRELRQSEEMCLELRRFSSDASIMKQQHESDVIAFKDEIAGLVSRLNVAEKQVAEAHYKVSDALVQLAQKDAVVSSLKRGRMNSIAPGHAAASTRDGQAAEGGGVMLRSKSITGIDRAFQEQLKTQISDLEKEKKAMSREIQEVVDMHETYRHHVETIIQDYEQRFMFYEDCLGQHQCTDSLSSMSKDDGELTASQAAALDDDSEEVTTVKALLVKCQGTLEMVQRANQIQSEAKGSNASASAATVSVSSSSDFDEELQQSRDAFESVLRATVQSVTLLDRLDSHCTEVVSIGEFRDGWQRVQRQWVDLIRRLVVVAAPASIASTESLLRKEALVKRAVEKTVEEKWIRVINTQYKVIAPVRDAMTQCTVAGVADASEQAGGPASAYTSSGTMTVKNTTESRATQSDAVPNTATSTAKSTMDAAKHDSSTVSPSMTPSVATSSSVIQRVVSLHKELMLCAKVAQKLGFPPPDEAAAPNSSGEMSSEWSTKPVVDPMSAYMSQGGDAPVSQLAGNAKWLDELLLLDSTLIKCVTAWICQEPSTELRFAAYQRASELYRLERTVDLVGKQPKQHAPSLSIRQDIANFTATCKKLTDESNKFEGVFDDVSLQRYARQFLDRKGGGRSYSTSSGGGGSVPQRNLAPPPPRTSLDSAASPVSSSGLPISSSARPSAAPPTAAERQEQGAARLRTSLTATDPSNAASQQPSDEFTSGGPLDSSQNGASRSPATSGLPQPAPARRNLFRQNPEERIVEQVRSSSPQSSGPTLATKLTEAITFAESPSRREGRLRGDPVWDSSSAPQARSPVTSVSGAGDEVAESEQATSIGDGMVLSLKNSPTNEAVAGEPADIPTTSSHSGPQSNEKDKGERPRGPTAPPASKSIKAPNAKGSGASKVPQPPLSAAAGGSTSAEPSATNSQRHSQVDPGRDESSLAARKRSQEGGGGSGRGSSPQDRSGNPSRRSTSPIPPNASKTAPTVTSLTPSAGPKVPPRPNLTQPARNAQGSFNAIDSSVFYVAPLADDDMPTQWEASDRKSANPSGRTSPVAGLGLGLVGGTLPSLSRKSTMAPSQAGAVSQQRAASTSPITRQQDVTQPLQRSMSNRGGPRPTTEPTPAATSPPEGLSLGAAHQSSFVANPVGKPLTENSHHPPGTSAAVALGAAIARLRHQTDPSLSLAPGIISSSRSAHQSREGGAAEGSTTRQPPSQRAVAPGIGKPTKPLASLGIPMGSPLPEDPAVLAQSNRGRGLPPMSASPFEDDDTGGVIVGSAKRPDANHESSTPSNAKLTGDASVAPESDRRGPQSPFSPVNHTVVSSVAHSGHSSSPAQYRQTLHGPVPQRLRGVTVMSNLLKEQRERELKELQEGAAMLERGVSNGGPRSQRSTSMPASSPRSGGVQSQPKAPIGTSKVEFLIGAEPTSDKPQVSNVGGSGGPLAPFSPVVPSGSSARASRGHSSVTSQRDDSGRDGREGSSAPQSTFSAQVIQANPELGRLLQGSTFNSTRLGFSSSIVATSGAPSSLSRSAR